MRTEVAWLVERGQPEGFEWPEWLLPVISHRGTEWTRDANNAQKYAEREHAEEAIEHHGLTARARPVEHGFISDVRRRRIELGDDAYLDVCLNGDPSDETIAALREIGEAAVARMRACPEETPHDA